MSLRTVTALLPAIVSALLVVTLKHALDLRDLVFLPIAGVVVFLASMAAAMIVSGVTVTEVIEYLLGRGPGGGSGVSEPEPGPQPLVLP